MLTTSRRFYEHPFRFLLGFVLSFFAMHLLCDSANAQVMTLGLWSKAGPEIVRVYVADAARKELAAHDSIEKAWHNKEDRSRDRKIGSLQLGRRTEINETWLWLDSPGDLLKVNVERFDLKEGRLHFAFDIEGRALVKAQRRTGPPIIQASIRGRSDVRIHVEGSTQAGLKGFSDTRIDQLESELREVRYDGPLSKVLEDPVTRTANRLLDEQHPKIRTELCRVIDEVRFSYSLTSK